ncbi:scavenger receptor class F member 1-like [Haliotis cracherodii]|uniref:scavenger receptor class F member 1-like n=1 Tax=Haliotis cracherodii TaxID=6455 RepID=UPI0039E9AD9F
MWEKCFVAFIKVAHCLIIPAADCRDSQHCTDCDQSTGNCNTECSAGYFGLKCNSVCNKNCKLGKCHLTVTGNDDCTHGCVPGYQGSSCNIPCDSPGGTCTACPGGCDGGYCQLGSSCVSGCVDSYYGTGCKNCSSRCKSCNRITGTCDECHPPNFGPDCEYSCANCFGSCRYGCLQGCVKGFYGYLCDSKCSANCRPPPSTTTIEDGDTQRPECHQKDGVCSHGCADGWFGPQCFYSCNANCKNGRCGSVGDCVDGCQDGWYGPQCSSPCSSKCMNGKCNATGVCVDGCVAGYTGRDCRLCTAGFHGHSCNYTCDVCLDGLCDQMSGTCVIGCNTTGLDCDPACSNNCTVADCVTGSCNQDESGDYIAILAGVPTTSVVVVVVILLAACLCYTRRSTTSDHEVKSGPDTSSSVQCQKLKDLDLDLDLYAVCTGNDYCEITNEDVDRARAARKQEQEEFLCVMPVLADCFHDEDGDDGLESYSRLLPGVGDPNAVVTYVSPIEE